MNKKTAMAIIVVGLMVLGVVLWALTRPNDSVNTDGQANVAAPASQTVPVQTIVYTDDGFQNPHVTVKSGATIAIKNESSGQLEFSSNDHPAHRNNDELNTEIIRPGETTTITVSEPGAWGYHDHLNAAHGGTITVVQ